ncbi:Hypothetical predicted protein [Olea europaea subsp. europaea]|uniref:Uncharacterized protein n=1 Tax=Olea europaea subsp. europaea TaxID=158383 RepID=A0A8S0T6H7_OLEEU|nr:Hypothetical predicted protein [Olea europaea subsp. europaea]
MHAALSLAPPAFPCTLSSLPPPKLCVSNCLRFLSIRTNALAVNYNSTISVFLVEACETIGEDSCIADIYSEVKLRPETQSNMLKIPSEPVDREYIDYADPRT